MNSENKRQKEDYNQLVKRHSELQAEKVQVEESYRKLVAEKNEVVDEEGVQLRGLVEELVGVVECPVCLVLPRHGGPVPVCPNGHFVCRTCRDQLRQEAGADAAKCPSCTIDLGNATSLLASRLVERVKHQCEHAGCNEMVEFAKFETHLQVCEFRLVLCPGRESCCKALIPFNKMEEHVSSCGGNDHFTNQFMTLENNAIMPYSNSVLNRGSLRYQTTTIKAHGKTFFCKMKRDEDRIYFWELVMLGSEEECKGFRASLAILEENDKVFAGSVFHPRPISQKGWEKMGLYVPEKNLASRTTENIYWFRIKISVDKI